MGLGVTVGPQRHRHTLRNALIQDLLDDGAGHLDTPPALHPAQHGTRGVEDQVHHPGRHRRLLGVGVDHGQAAGLGRLLVAPLHREQELAGAAQLAHARLEAANQAGAIDGIAIASVRDLGPAQHLVLVPAVLLGRLAGAMGSLQREDPRPNPGQGLPRRDFAAGLLGVGNQEDRSLPVSLLECPTSQRQGGLRVGAGEPAVIGGQCLSHLQRLFGPAVDQQGAAQRQHVEDLLAGFEPLGEAVQGLVDRRLVAGHAAAAVPQEDNGARRLGDRQAVVAGWDIHRLRLTTAARPP